MLPHVNCVHTPAALDSTAIGAGKGGVFNKQKTTEGRGEGALHSEAVVSGSHSSGRGYWQAQVMRVCSVWWGRVTRALHWLRLLDFWQFLRRTGGDLRKLVVKAVVRLAHALRSSISFAGSPGIEHVRRQHMVLAAASIALMAIHLQSDGGRH